MTLSLDEVQVLNYIRDIADMHFARSEDEWWDRLSNMVTQKLDDDLKELDD